MPLYEYECSTCGALFEQLRGMGDADPACPRCESAQIVRRISVFASTSGGMRTPSPAGGGCACGGSCMCGGH